MKSVTKLVTVILFGLAISLCGRAETSAQWTRVRSANFTLIGNASPTDLDEAARRLELFRIAFGKSFPAVPLSPSRPTRLIAFGDDSSFQPFKVDENNGGFFQTGSDVDYMTFELDRKSPYTFGVMYHECSHYFLHNYIKKPPLWLNEGLAEYFSTFSARDGVATEGNINPALLALVKRTTLIPIRELFAVDVHSVWYAETDRKALFYSESALLIHYLLHGKHGAYSTHFPEYLDRLARGEDAGDAFATSFGSSPESVFAELSGYIAAKKHLNRQISLAMSGFLENVPVVEQLSYGDANGYLGDLLIHLNRIDSAETYLNQGLAVDPASPVALATLGILRARQDRIDEATPLLERAVKANTDNYLAHYYYAFILSRVGADSTNKVHEYPPALAELMRSELKKTIALAPTFSDPYNLLGFISLITGEEIEESIRILKSGTVHAEDQREMTFLLAQLYIRNRQFPEARVVLDPLTGEGVKSEISTRARLLLRDVNRLEAGTPLASGASDTSALDEESESRLRDALVKPGQGESELQGRLLGIDCGDGRIIFNVTDGTREIRLFSSGLNAVRFVAYASGQGREITCGPRVQDSEVLIIYKPISPDSRNLAGEVRILQFLPKNFRLGL